MSATKEFSLSDISEHTGKKDLFMIIHEKVYDTSSFVDEHPGGEEVLLDVGGQDATEAFEDVGHSDEAREILQGLLIGTLKRSENDPKPKSAVQQTAQMAKSAEIKGGNLGLYVLVAVLGVVGFFAYNFLAADEGKA